MAIILQDVDTFIAGHDVSDAQEKAICEIGGRCKKVLEDINSALDKYSSLGTKHAEANNTKLRERVRRVWQQVKLEPEEFRDYRHEITACVAMLNAFISGITRDGVTKLVIEQERQADQAILEWLSGSDYAAQQSNNVNQRLKNTGQWLLESSEYQDWVSSSSKVLLLNGMPGAGKTILSSIIVEQLQKKCRDDIDVGLVYFYCDFSRQEAQQFDQVMLAWLRQLAESSTNIPLQISEFYKRHRGEKTKPSLEKIRETIRTLAKTLTKFYVVVDALDECQALDGCQRQLIYEILDLQKTIGANVLATSRPITHIQEAFHAWNSIEIRATNDDIGNYVDKSIADLPNFVITSSELQEETKISIVEAADGM